MRWNWLKKRTWTLVTVIHSDVRVAALLRTVALLGIFAGFGGFMIGLNPIVAGIVVGLYDPGGDVLLRVGIAGLLVHLISMGYYYATAPELVDDGMIRY